MYARFMVQIIINVADTERYQYIKMGSVRADATNYLNRTRDSSNGQQKELHLVVLQGELESFQNLTQKI